MDGEGDHHSTTPSDPERADILANGYCFCPHFVAYLTRHIPVKNTILSLIKMIMALAVTLT